MYYSKQFTRRLDLSVRISVQFIRIGQGKDLTSEEQGKNAALSMKSQNLTEILKVIKHSWESARN